MHPRPASGLRYARSRWRRPRLRSVGAARRLFAEKGFAATSVEDVAHEARLTTGALYHHFPNKTALFESVFEGIHAELMDASIRAAAEAGPADDIELLARGFEAFLDAVLEPDVQRIVITDAPAVLGLARFTELDERYAFAAITALLRSASTTGTLRADDPETLARLLLGALTRGGMLIANSPQPRETPRCRRPLHPGSPARLVGGPARLRLRGIGVRYRTVLYPHRPGTGP